MAGGAFAGLDRTTPSSLGLRTIAGSSCFLASLMISASSAWDATSHLLIIKALQYIWHRLGIEGIAE